MTFMCTRRSNGPAHAAIVMVCSSLVLHKYLLGVSSFPITSTTQIKSKHIYYIAGVSTRSLPDYKSTVSPLNAVLDDKDKRSTSSIATDDTAEDDKGVDDGDVGQVDSIRQKMFSELEKLRQQFSELTESLGQVKKEEEEAKGKFWKLREQKEEADLEKEEAIQSAKKTLRDEMDDLSDKLENCQDNLRETILKTRSEVSSIQTQAKETESRLRSEISDLESRLDALRQEAESAANARDELEQTTKKEMEDIRTSSRKEMDAAKKATSAEKKGITRENWSLETRIQQAGMDYIAAEKELRKEEEVTPTIPTLKSTLEAVTKRMRPQVEEKEQRSLAEFMFFARKIKSAKTDMREDFERAKSSFINAKTKEGEKLENTISEYEMKLLQKEKELESRIKSSEKRAERSVADAITDAKQRRIELYQDKFESIQRQKKERKDALDDALEAQSVWQDQYDAEYENEIRNLQNERVLVKEQLKEEERQRQEQRNQLEIETEKLTGQLMQQMQDEKEAADADFLRVKDAKASELAGSMSRTKKAMDDIQVTRSNLLLVRGELRKLERVSKENEVVLRELEDERASFRKQFRRTFVVAADRLTLKRFRNRKKSID
mmetsp:Transcript_12448/g.26285  ORF Transcript_12448/g.26285 Transcript_12448/m.26285 type:complete len:607 (-) Transcript_12448:323-2143(-)